MLIGFFRNVGVCIYIQMVCSGEIPHQGHAGHMGTNILLGVVKKNLRTLRSVFSQTLNHQEWFQSLGFAWSRSRPNRSEDFLVHVGWKTRFRCVNQQLSARVRYQSSTFDYTVNHGQMSFCVKLEFLHPVQHYLFHLSIRGLPKLPEV